MTVLDKINAKLVEDVADWHRWWSMRWIIIAAALEALKAGWAGLPPRWIDWLPDVVPHALGVLALIATVNAGVARVTKQKTQV